MGKFLKDSFIIVRIILMLLFCAYGFIDKMDETGVPVKVLLLVAFYISVMSLKELVEGKIRLVFFALAAAAFAVLIYIGGFGFILLGCFLYLELISFLKCKAHLYFLIYLVLFINSPIGIFNQLIFVTLLLVCYLQHDFVIEAFRKQMMEDLVSQQGLKKDMTNREVAAREAIKKNTLMSENKILEERAALSQTLHDKLGHNINGSIYQLEASKVIMDKDPEKSKQMIQGVIDQLRTGMDEIRAILRKERPEKKKMALLQLHELCADCNEKGVEAELSIEGNTSVIPNDIWEVILDNSFEAVSNSMKYSKCSHINITIIVMNKMVRCVISDDGIGCDKIVDGMGISGMRQRIRSVGGTIDFESEAGFKVSTLLPLK